MTTGERIKHLREKQGLTQVQLADKLNISKQTLYKYENNITSHIPGDIVKNASFILNVSPAYLMGWNDKEQSATPPNYEKHITDFLKSNDTFIKSFVKTYMEIPKSTRITIQHFFKKVANNIEETNPIFTTKTTSSPTDTPPERISAPYEQSFKTIPYYYGLSAGTGIYHLGNDYSELIDIPNTPEYKYVTYAAKVNGDSMQPTFIDGETVLIARDITPLVSETGVFVIDGEMFIKERGKDRLISHNPKYEDIILSEYMNIVCEGKVIGKL